jgi:hypothetical protein
MSSVRLIESQKRGPADDGRILCHWRCSSRSGGLRSSALRGNTLRIHTARLRQWGRRCGCAKRGRAVRRALSRYGSDGNSLGQQLGAAHAAEAVRIRILISATSAAQTGSSCPQSIAYDNLNIRCSTNPDAPSQPCTSSQGQNPQEQIARNWRLRYQSDAVRRGEVYPECRITKSVQPAWRSQ